MSGSVAFDSLGSVSKCHTPSRAYVFPCTYSARAPVTKKKMRLTTTQELWADGFCRPHSAVVYPRTALEGATVNICIRVLLSGTIVVRTEGGTKNCVYLPHVCTTMFGYEYTVYSPTYKVPGNFQFIVQKFALEIRTAPGNTLSA